MSMEWKLLVGMEMCAFASHVWQHRLQTTWRMLPCMELFRTDAKRVGKMLSISRKLLSCLQRSGTMTSIGEGITDILEGMYVLARNYKRWESNWLLASFGICPMSSRLTSISQIYSM